MPSSDLRQIKKIADEYFQHLQKEPDSLLVRIYGVYSIKIGGKTPVNLMLMQNTLQIDKERLEYIFDLKGSSIRRKVNMKHGSSNTTVLRDTNFLELLR
jgi:1-phosphatidylinositol-4-phosphate 5-kinase